MISNSNSIRIPLYPNTLVHTLYLRNAFEIGTVVRVYLVANRIHVCTGGYRLVLQR